MTLINNLNSEDLCFHAAKFSVRLLAAADKGFYQQLYSDPQVMQFIGTPLISAEANRSFAAALLHNERLNQDCHPSVRVFMIIEDTDSKQSAGLLSVTLSQTETEIAHTSQYDAELGIMLLPVAQKAGLAQAAIAGLCQQLRLQPQLYRFKFCTAASNIAAKKLVSRLGFVYCEKCNCYQLLK